MKKYKCSVCGYVYDESDGIPGKNLPPGTRWEDIPEDFTCPLCSAPKSLFILMDIQDETKENEKKSMNTYHDGGETLKDLSFEEISAICSSLAKGCEKQRQMPEMEAFYSLARYYKSKSSSPEAKGFDKGFKNSYELLNTELLTGFPAASSTAMKNSDRGALRSLVWSEKVSIMMKSLLERYEKEGDAILENTNIHVCDICGFIFLGDKVPDLCPVCKVPPYLLLKIERS